MRILMQVGTANPEHDPSFVPKGIDRWAVFAADEHPHIDAEWTVDADNNAASPEQLERWRVGGCKLWTARLFLRVKLVEVSEPTAKELVELTGFEEV